MARRPLFDLIQINSDNEQDNPELAHLAQQAHDDPALLDDTETKATVMDTLTPIVDTLTTIADDLALHGDAAIKAGRRHNAADQAMVQSIYDAACDVAEMAVALGAEEEMDDDEYEETEIGGEVEVIEGKSDDDAALLTTPGAAIKAVGNGLVEGYLIKFGGDGDLSQYRDVFTRQTDYGRAVKSDVWVHHRMLPGLGKRRLSNQAEISIDDEGVFIKHLLDLRSSYEAKLYGLVDAGKLSWSSGTAPHLVERKALSDGRHEIEQWPLGLDASYTPTPAGGFATNAGAMKSLLADAGIDLLTAIYDNPEANETKTQRHDGAEADADRERRLLLLRSRLLALQE